jgi:flagellar basal-body rod protein FlgF
MLKGLYSAASAMIANMNRQTLISHNVSNVETPGFKSTMSTMEDFYKTPVWAGEGGSSPAAPFSPVLTELSLTDRFNYIGAIGLGVQSSQEVTDFTQGALLQSGQPLDMAIQGEGFFRIKTADGECYTRDGRFSRDNAGNLVTVDGYKVLSKSGQPIKFTQQGEIAVSPAGLITVNGISAGQVGLASFTDPKKQLVRGGDNYYKAVGKPDGKTVGTIAQGYTEGSNVNVAMLMTQMISVARSYEAAQQLVTQQDTLLGKAISTLGKI